MESFSNLVGRMSLGERLGEDLRDPDTDKRNPNGLSRLQVTLSFHMVVRVEQHDLETSPRRVCLARKRLLERGKGRSIAD